MRTVAQNGSFKVVIGVTPIGRIQTLTLDTPLLTTIHHLPRLTFVTPQCSDTLQ
jgi:hypothetical protein